MYVSFRLRIFNINMAEQKKKSKKLTLGETKLVSSQLIQDLMNRHITEEGKLHGRFHCGKQLGFGGNGIVYQLRYDADSPDSSEEDIALSRLSLAVKVFNPIQAFVSNNPLKYPDETKLDVILGDAGFAPFMRSGKRVLSSVAMCHENKFFEHHFLHYYPDLSFSIDKEIPYASIIVMDEVVGTLSDIRLPEDMPSIIKMTVKLGKEIGSALQAAEHANNDGVFLHRDLKPANIGIVINFENQDVFEFVLIDIDSGIVLNVNEENPNTRVVNPFCLCPDLNSDIPASEIDYARVDMFYLGHLMKYISGVQFDLLPNGLKRIIKKAAHKEPTHRYDDGNELIRQLEQFEKSYAAEGIKDSINIRRFIDEHNEQLAENKRQLQVHRNEFTDKLNKKRERIRELESEVENLGKDVKQWKLNYDKQIEQEEKLRKEYENYKASASSPLISRISIRKNGKTTAVISRDYDEKGRLLREYNPESGDWIEKEYCYKDDGNVEITFLNNGVKIASELRDSQNRLLNTSSYRNNEKAETKVYRYTYTHKGRLSSVYINEVLSEKHTYVFYDSGILKEHNTSVYSDTMKLVHNEKFNPQGFLSTLITWVDDPGKEDSYYTKITYSYDENNLQTRAVYEDEDLNVFRESNRFYDSQKRLLAEISVDYRFNDTMTREYTY